MGDVIVGITASSLLEEILKLPRHDRASIAVEVLNTLDDEGSEIDDEELVRELQRREAEGMEGSVSWSVLREMP